MQRREIRRSIGEDLARAHVALRATQLEPIVTLRMQQQGDIADFPTVKTPAMPQVTRELPLESILSVKAPSAHRPSRPTRPILPLDEQQRPYVKLRDPNFPCSEERPPVFSLLELVEDAVTQYYRAQQCYPPAVLLGAYRFAAAKRLDAYYTENGQDRLLYVMAEHADFCVMVV